MADHGTVTAIPLDAVSEIGGYSLAGSVECPPIPGPPTTGQVWPRGNP